ncbi:hypothetical protein HDU96_008806 [Phlyctochytrium bullatum]|nr:hypothetical protein HDU96_008806 [Phlyctochytrium bullatum]
MGTSPVGSKGSSLSLDRAAAKGSTTALAKQLAAAQLAGAASKRDGPRMSTTSASSRARGAAGISSSVYARLTRDPAVYGSAALPTDSSDSDEEDVEDEDERRTGSADEWDSRSSRRASLDSTTNVALYHSLQRIGSSSGIPSMSSYSRGGSTSGFSGVGGGSARSSPLGGSRRASADLVDSGRTGKTGGPSKLSAGAEPRTPPVKTDSSNSIDRFKGSSSSSSSANVAGKRPTGTWMGEVKSQETKPPLGDKPELRRSTSSVNSSGSASQGVPGIVVVEADPRRSTSSRGSASGKPEYDYDDNDDEEDDYDAAADRLRQRLLSRLSTPSPNSTLTRVSKKDRGLSSPDPSTPLIGSSTSIGHPPPSRTLAPSSFSTSGADEGSVVALVSAAMEMTAGSSSVNLPQYYAPEAPAPTASLPVKAAKNAATGSVDLLPVNDIPSAGANNGAPLKRSWTTGGGKPQTDVPPEPKAITSKPSSAGSTMKRESANDMGKTAAAAAGSRSAIENTKKNVRFTNVTVIASTRRSRGAPPRSSKSSYSSASLAMAVAAAAAAASTAGHRKATRTPPKTSPSGSKEGLGAKDEYTCPPPPGKKRDGANLVGILKIKPTI